MPRPTPTASRAPGAVARTATPAAADAASAGAAQLQRLVDLLPVGAAYVEGERVVVNPAVEAITGYAGAELTTLSAWFAALYGENARRVRATYDADRPDGFRAPRISRIRRKDGALRYVEFVGRTEGGAEVWGLRDVSERVRSDQVLRLIARSAVLLGGARDVDTMLDEITALCVPRLADACIIDLALDGPVVRRLGAARLPAERRALLETLVVRSAAAGPQGALADALSTRLPQLVTGTCCDVDAKLAGSDPELRELAHRLQAASALVVPMVARGGSIGAITFLVMDAVRAFERRDVALVTEFVAPVAVAVQSAHLHAVVGQQQQERLALLNNIPDPAWLKDRAGRYVAVNAAYCRATQRPAEAIVGRTAEELFDPDRAARYQAQDDRALAAGVQVIIEDEYVDADGRPRRLETLTTPYRDGAGEIAGVVGIAHDVTERHTLEAQFRQAQKMEAIGRLAGGVAHDFNNLLTVISGSADFLLADLSCEDPRRADALEVKRTAQRGAALTRQLLTFSRRQVVQRRRVSLSAVVRDAERMLARLIGEDIALETQLGDDLGTVHADPGQLEQALLNLVVNARDAMPNGGRLTIATRRQGGEAALSVHDTGVGMDAATRDRLFEPFFTTKEPGRGTGLGLATVFGIVNQADGRVLVDSVPGQGSTFTLLFPMDDSRVEDVAAAGERVLPHRGAETVLVVEDDPSVRRLTRRALEELGYTVLDAGTAPEALTIAARHLDSLDVVLADVVLPGGSGREVVGALLGQRPALRALLMSGYAADALVQHRVSELDVPFLEKPFTVDGLAAAIRGALT